MARLCVQDFQSEEIQRDAHVIQSDHDGGYNNHNVFVRYNCSTAFCTPYANRVVSLKSPTHHTTSLCVRNLIPNSEEAIINFFSKTGPLEAKVQPLSLKRTRYGLID